MLFDKNIYKLLMRNYKVLIRRFSISSAYQFHESTQPTQFYLYMYELRITEHWLINSKSDLLANL